ncbi:MAG: NAD(+) synthase [Candidatus Sericytochromatia bacterium]|nr:NAD(+) synthase [Candidatus Tanganyikabacteria bacterium]
MQHAIEPSPLDLDCAAEAERLRLALRAAVNGTLKRKGAIVAVSGGVDSAVCLGLAAGALGPERVLALLLPECESSPESRRLAEAVAARFGVRTHAQDITGALGALGCYGERDSAIRELFPAYDGHAAGWRSKIAIAGGLDGGINFFKLIVRDPAGLTHAARMPHETFLRVVAAQNYKQRVRKAIEYHHADRLRYAVVGTPNRLEYALGFFVKNGDGSADVKPIAHLFKTQVYALAAYLGVPAEIRSAPPSTDTYSLPQGQDEFFFGLPYDRMDLALWAHDQGLPAAAAAARMGVPEALAELVYRDIDAKRTAAAYLHASPLTL